MEIAQLALENLAAGFARQRVEEADVAAAYPDLVRVAPQKLASVSDLWLLAHPDLVDLPAVRAVIGFVTACAREDRVMLRG